MGEKIKDIGNFSLHNCLYSIELNHSSTGSNIPEIHIQSENGRLEMSAREFLVLSSAVKLAAQTLKSNKKVL